MAQHMNMAIDPKRATSILKGLREESAHALYADGARLRLGPARIVTYRRDRETWIQWGGVRVTRAGTIVAVELGAVRVELTPEDVFVDMTFSASLPLSTVRGTRLRAD